MEIELIIIIVGFSIAFLLEARHDFIISNKEALIQYLLENRNKEKKEQIEFKREWHKKDWQYLVVIALVVAFTYKGFTLLAFPVLVMIASLKILVFNIRLNSLFGNDWFYLSSDGFESYFKGKEMFYYAIAAVLLIASIVMLWMMK